MRERAETGVVTGLHRVAASGSPVFGSRGHKRRIDCWDNRFSCAPPPQQAGEHAQHAGRAEEQRSKNRRPVHDVVEQVFASAGPAKHAAGVIVKAHGCVRTGESG